MQFVAITLLTTAFDPFQAFLLSIMVNARHMFYGLALLDRYKGLGKIRAVLIYTLCDETFSLVSSLEPPPEATGSGIISTSPCWTILIGWRVLPPGSAGEFHHISYHGHGLRPDGAVCGAVSGAVEKTGEPPRRDHRRDLCRRQPGGIWGGEYGDPRHGPGFALTAGRRKRLCT